MTNVLLPHSSQTCQGFSSPLVYWWYWPKFPFWTYNGKVRQNRLVPCWPGWLPLPERELLGDYDDRREVTYYLPTPQEIALANELFPGQGLAPPWDQVCDKLESYLPWASVHKLKCDQALALYRWAIVCEREQQQQRAQQTFVNLVSEAILKLLLEDCQRQKQAEAEKAAAEQPVEVSAPDKVTAEQSKGAAPSASQQGEDKESAFDHSNRKNVTREEANIRAREVLKRHPPPGKERWTVRILADAIGCSESLVSKLSAWKAYYAKWKEQHPHSVRAIPMTAPIEDSLAARDAELHRLVEEQERDAKSRHCYIPDSR